MSAPNRNEGTVGQADTPYGFEVTLEASADAVRAALGHIRTELADRKRTSRLWNWCWPRR